MSNFNPFRVPRRNSTGQEVSQTFSADVNLQKCAVSICGETDSNLSYTDLEAEQSSIGIYRAGTDEYKLFDELLDRALAQTVPNQTQLLKEIEVLSSGDMSAIEPKIFAFANVIRVMEVYKKLLIHQYDAGSLAGVHEIPDFSEEAMKAAGIEVDYVWISELLASGLFAVVWEVFAFYETPFEVYVKLLLPGMNRGEGLVEILNNCSEFRAHVFEFMGFPESHPAMDYCVPEADRDSSEPLDVGRLKRDYFMAKVFWYAFNDPILPILTKDKLDMTKLAKEFKKTANYQGMLASQSADYSTDKIRVKTDCHQQIGSSLNVSGSRLRQRAVDKNVELVKEAAKKMVKFSDPALRRQFEDALSELRMQAPPTRARLAKLFQGKFEQAIEISKEARAKFKLEGFFGMDFVNNVVSDYSPQYDSNGVPDTLFEEVTDVCSHYESPPLTDGIYTATGDAFLSWSVVRNLRYGRGVMAHEVGHFVSSWLKKSGSENQDAAKVLGSPARTDTYESVQEVVPVWEHRRCVDAYHPKQDISAEGKYTEEDWADYFAAKILKSLESDFDDVKNFACMLMRENDQGYRIYENNDPDSSHSAAIFRLIHVEKEWKGRLPKSCRSYATERMYCPAPRGK